MAMCYLCLYTSGNVALSAVSANVAGNDAIKYTPRYSSFIKKPPRDSLASLNDPRLTLLISWHRRETQKRHTLFSRELLIESFSEQPKAYRPSVEHGFPQTAVVRRKKTELKMIGMILSCKEATANTLGCL